LPLIKKTLEPRFENERDSIRDLVSLQEGLNGPNEDGRRWAARDLADFPEAVLPLFARLQAEPSRAVREAIFTSLLRIGNLEAHESLIKLLRSEDTELRNSAIEVLKGQPPEVASLFERLVADIDPDVRIFAVGIIGCLKHNEASLWLTRVLANDLNINVCCAAIEFLADIGSVDSIPVLEAAKDRFFKQEYVVFASNMAIENILRREGR
jgi:HEAT repeat protein